MIKTIVVNATALESSGALTILQQFLDAIPYNETNWIIFISDKIQILNSKDNVRLAPVVNVKSLIRRFFWDTFGVKKWLKKENIHPFASISLQNTGFRTGHHIPTFIYYHQSIPFFKHKWSFFNKRQRSLWFYKNIYPFFVQLYINQQTKIFVQLNYIKDEFVKMYKVPSTNVHVITPSFILPDKETIEPDYLPENKINLFYPATSYFYKNHAVLVEALKMNPKIFSLYVTVDRKDFFTEDKFIHYMGKISYSKVLAMYMAADALVFPSYIETYGLPLLEAASLGLPILVSDLPYAREVLKGYEGVIFIDYAKPEIWKKELMKIKKGVRFPPFKPLTGASWPILFDILK